MATTSWEQAEFAQAAGHFAAGRFTQAEDACRRLLAATPEHPDLLHLLGLVAYQTGRADLAARHISKAIALRPGNATYHFNLALAWTGQGQPDDAIAAYAKAIALKPDYVKAQINLGNLHRDKGELDEAMELYSRAIAIKPDYAQAHNNLGGIHWDQGRLGSAEACYRRAVGLTPGDAQMQRNLGSVLQGQGKLDEAVACYHRAIAAAPQDADSYFHLARALHERDRAGDSEAALRQGLRLMPDAAPELAMLALLLLQQGRQLEAQDAILQSLHTRECDAGRQIFAYCVRRFGWMGDSSAAQDLMERALREAWDRPNDLAKGAADMLAQAGGELDISHPLLAALLRHAPNADMVLERKLTQARRALVENAQEGTELSGTVFYSALAQQCFINEYVFAFDDDEMGQALALRGRLEDALSVGGDVPVSLLLAVAAYFPLGTLSQSQRLVDMSWPDEIREVIVQQIVQPAEEQRLRAGITRLTPVEDAVSQRVQAQYEENPYPRWVHTGPVQAAKGTAHLLHEKFPLTVSRPSAPQRRFDILIAGSGTGQHSIETAQCFPAAQVLAMDLSLSSLSYALRKTNEIGLTRIEYGQGDIMALDGLDRSFDLIESVGVLHHMGDPFAGWGKLVKRLAPGGYMRLGFYSATARRPIAAARALVAAAGYDGGNDAIRKTRQDIAGWPDRQVVEALLCTPDFFTTSNCRDLVFHTEEHCLTLEQIAAFLKDNRLHFLGFDVEEEIRSAYRRRFSNDPAATNLEQWAAFEADNPFSFAAMYQFWVQQAP